MEGLLERKECKCASKRGRTELEKLSRTKESYLDELKKWHRHMYTA